MENNYFPLDISAGAELVDLFFPESFSSFFADLFPRRHLESISQVLENDWSNVFASTLTVFSTNFFQKFSSQPHASNWAWIESLRPF